MTLRDKKGRYVARIGVNKKTANEYITEFELALKGLDITVVKAKDYKIPTEFTMDDLRIVFAKEYQKPFKAIKRKWRIDYADPVNMLAIEVDGGLFQRGKGPGGHNRGAYLRDHQYPKDRHLQLNGWTVLRYLPEELLTIAIPEILKFYRKEAQNEL